MKTTQKSTNKKTKRFLQLKNYPIYKKRDGQSFELICSIYAAGFITAKKELAQKIANDLYSDCNLTYLTAKELNNKFESGFYFNGSLVWNENNTISINDSYIECFLSQKQINKGITYFNEDVYTYELRKK